MPQSLQEIMQQISAPYQAQRDLIAQQQAALGGQETAAIQGADAQKDIAFNQIRQSANDDGVLYSGRPSEMSNRYVAANYAPAVAGIKSQTLQQGAALTQALLNTQQQQGQQAYGVYNDQLNREQQDRQFQQQQAAATKQYQQQLAAQQAATRQQATRGYGITNDPTGGYKVVGPDGQSATLAQYTGGNVQAVLQYLRNGNAGDKQLAASVSKMNLNDANTLSKLQQQYPWVFGGV